jgi:hypothetical protein
LHIMQTNNKGWDYCGNAQASVDGRINHRMRRHSCNCDQQQAVPMRS